MAGDELPFSARQAAELRRRLLAWYRRQARALAWREGRDPWAVWLSEVLLQQTRAEQVEPYYRRLLAAYPTVQALAAAPLEELLSHWSGLGYYRRVRLLHSAARQVAAAGGEVPATVAELRRLPGIGAYTAAAVASIAFGVAEPAVDGNVERVGARLLALEASPRKARERQRLHSAARQLLTPGAAGDSNQALMDLGALVCLPRRPRCGGCPLAGGCRARALGQVERYPPPRPRRAQQHLRLTLAVVTGEGGAVLLFRRPEGEAPLAGSWELPWAAAEPAAPVAAGLAARYGGRWRLGEELGRLRHSITFRRLEVAVRRARVRPGEEQPEAPEAGWFDAGQRARLPLSSLVTKALRLLEGREVAPSPSRSAV